MHNNRILRVTSRIRMRQGTAKLIIRMQTIINLPAVESSNSPSKGEHVAYQFLNRRLQFKLNLNKRHRRAMWFLA
jgi:hypothetical protein